MKRCLKVSAAAVIAVFFCGASFPGEDFSLNIRGGPERTDVSFSSSGEITSIRGELSFIRGENLIRAEIRSPEGKPLIRLPGAEAGGFFSAELAVAEDSMRIISGHILGEDIFFRLPGDGVFFEKGELSARAAEGSVILEKLEFGHRGAASASGEIKFENGAPSLEAYLEFREYRLFDRPDAKVSVSGRGALESNGDKLQFTGEFSIDSADIFLSGAQTVHLPAPDIVVKGEEPPDDRPHPFEQAKIRLNLGRNFRLRTPELDTKLEGALAVEATGDDMLPSVTGTVRTRDGSVSAYGQELYLRRGVISFTGPPDNPSLDILAIHMHREIDVGIRVTGTLAAPEIELYSSPDMPDAEKLSVLILGRRYETAAGADISLIAAAAAGILAPEEYARLESELLRTTGLDEIRLAPEEEADETVVVLGKRLSSRLYFTYRRGLAGLTNAAVLEYILSPRWKIRAETGYDSLVGITYSIAFD